MWGVLNGFLHGAALLGTAGVDATAYAPLAVTSIATMGDWLTGYAQQIDDRAYPVVDATLRSHVAAMTHVIDESAAAGVNLELPRLVKALADRAVAAGHGDEEYAALIEVLRTPAGARS